MPRATASPIRRLTDLFLTLDGAERAVALDVFAALHHKQSTPLPKKSRPATVPAVSTTVATGVYTTPSGKPMRKPRVAKVKPLASPTTADSTSGVFDTE